MIHQRSANLDFYEKASWPDLLTKISIGNTTETITYPVSNGMVTAGTQLATAVKDGITASYSYDMDGIRNSKTVGNTVYHFDTLSGKVMHQTGASRELWFIYDENGQPFMLITKEGTEVNEYWYLLNAVGDVVGLMDSSQQIVAEYSYDPFGRIISEWTDTDDNVGTVNPLRYRSYYYDTETGFYYLESRYYDPAIGRFISADTFAATSSADFLSCNMFAYCLNDPVNRFDSDGNWSMPNWLKLTIGVGTIAGLSIATVCVGGTAAVVFGAALSGATIGGTSGALIGAVGGGFSGGWKGFLDGACSGFMSGTLIGGVTGAALAGLNIASGVTTVAGNAHGSTVHKLATNIEAGKMAASGQYSQIGINKSLGKMGLNGGRTRPDVIGIANNGLNILVEVVSPRQNIII